MRVGRNKTKVKELKIPVFGDEEEAKDARIEKILGGSKVLAAKGRCIP